LGTIAAEHYNDAFVWKYTGSHGYQDTPIADAWYKVLSVEWSGLTSDLSTAASYVAGHQDTTPPLPPTGLVVN
jgi:hypothetical protein